MGVTAAELERRMSRVKIFDVVGDILARNIDKVRDKNIQQLMQGLDHDGRPLSPKYSEDPYFKSKQAAENYARWKKALYPETPFDVPNLIITGVYHNSIAAKRSGSNLQFSADASFAGSVQAKYGDKQLGLDPESKHELWAEVVRGPLIQEISSQTGIKTK